MNNETPLAQGQVDVDVRAQFEDWFYDGFAGSIRRNRDGEYEYMPAHVAWITWQAAFKAGREACAKVVTQINEELCEHDENV